MKPGVAPFKKMISPYPEPIQKMALELRKIVYAVIPEAEEAMMGGAKVQGALYSVGGPNKVVCGIMPSDEMCRLFLHHFASISHPKIKIEGTGKHARHVKIRKLDREMTEAARSAVEQAYAAHLKKK